MSEDDHAELVSELIATGEQVDYLSGIIADLLATLTRGKERVEAAK